MRMKELLAQRAKLKAEAQKIIEAAEQANRAPEENEQKRLDAIKTEAEALETRIANQALIDDLDRQAQGAAIGGGDRAWEQELRSFSLCNLIASAFEQTVDAGREREICREQQTRVGKKVEGFLVPFEAVAPHRRIEQRVLTVAGDGSNLVATELMASEFIEALRPASVVARLGARTLTGLRGDIALPKRDARTPAPAWFAENAAINSGDQSFTQVTGSPKHLGVITEFGRKTMLQATPEIEALTREHFMAELGIGVDLAALKGGGGSAPTGITQTGSINTKAGGGSDPTWDDVVDVQAAVEAADVPQVSLGWALNAYVKAKARKTLKVSADAGAGFLWDMDGLGGAPGAVTSQLDGTPGASPAANGEAIYGAWGQLIVAMWSGVEILVNPYESTAYSKGNVSVRGIVDADVLVRHPQAFNYWSGIGIESA